MRRQIDLNCDLGESYGVYDYGASLDIMRFISSANIACGFHSGDPLVMVQTVEKAKELGVKLGAHPGYPDLQGFGRREMKLTYKEIYALVLYQLGALAGIAQSQGIKLNHVKAHGALYNQGAKDLEIAEAIAQAVKDFDYSLEFYALANSQLESAGIELGLRVVREVFADRSYNKEGMLVPRNQPGAVIEDKEQVLEQVALLLENKVRALSGEIIEIQGETICIHGDTPNALRLAQDIHSFIRSKGVKIL